MGVMMKKLDVRIQSPRKASKNSKLIGYPQWNPTVHRRDNEQSCLKAECKNLPVSLGGTGGLFLVKEGPNKGAFIKKNNVVVFREANHEAPAIYKDKAGHLLERIPVCFAHDGNPIRAFHTSIKYSDGSNLGLAGLQKSIDNTPRDITIVRGCVVGNASTALSERSIKKIDDLIRKKNKLGHILYDHAWNKNKWIAKYATLSCSSLEDIGKAAEISNRLSYMMDWDKESLTKVKTLASTLGFVALKCPEQTGHSNCNRCRLCDVKKKPSKKLIILFEDHGGGASWGGKKKKYLSLIEHERKRTEQKLKPLQVLKRARAEGKTKIKRITIARIEKWFL